MTILIVEDDAGISELIEEKIAELGYNSKSISTANDALYYLETHSPYLIILDYSLPDMSGKEFIEDLRKRQQILPAFIVSTGHGNEDIAVEMMKLGARDYIVKDTYFLEKLPEVVKRNLVQIENENRLKKAEEALQENEEKYRFIIENLNDIVLKFDSSFRITYLSPNYCKIFQKSKKNLLGNDFLSLVNLENRSKIKYSLKSLTEKPNTMFYEEHADTVNGMRWFAWSVKAVVRNDGDISEIISVGRDITDQKLTEDAMQAVVKSNVGLVGQDFFDNVVKSVCSWLGCEIAIIGELKETSMVKAIAMQADNEKVYDFTYSLTHTPCENVVDQGYCIFSENVTHKFPRDPDLARLKAEGYVGTPLYDNRGKPIGIIVVISRKKLTLGEKEKQGLNLIAARASAELERRQVEKDIKESEKRYRQYFEENLAGSYISDPAGHLITCNKKYLEIFGFKNTQEAIETPIYNIFDKKYKRDAFLAAITENRRVINKESTFVRVDGSCVTVVENASGVFDEKRNLIHIRGFLLDISEQRRLESQILQTQKMETIGTLAGGIAHDFNNILFPIVGHSEMLLDDVPQDSPFRYGLNEIYNSALRAKSLVKQILTFSRQEETELKLFKIQPVLKEVLALIRATIPTTIDITTDIQKNCGAIKADPTQIHQIIMNLTTNAYHAMEHIGGKMHIQLKEVVLGNKDLVNSCMVQGLYACLIVKDTGVGIDNTIIHKIFDPFFTTKEKEKGTGMGLSVVHGIVKKLKGDIQVLSEPGKGSTFCIHIPIQSGLKKQIEKTNTIILGANESILLVDDEKSIINMEQQLLERIGYRVTSYTNSLEALEAFCKTPDQFDMVISDLAMPNMPGDQFAAELIKLRPEIPILLCTGFSETLSEKKMSSLGIKGIILKPIVMQDLAQKIRQVLEGGRVRR